MSFIKSEVRLNPVRLEIRNTLAYIILELLIGEGGDLTLFMTGKKPRPCTEPMYSGGNRRDFPVSSGFDSVQYTDFISGQIKNTKKILISQSMYDGKLCTCFATSKRYNPRPAQTWWITASYDTFVKFLKEQWAKSRRLYSLACDEKFGFGVFFMKNFGTRQSIVTDTSKIKEKFDDGFRITACAARGSTFYVVMTKGTKEYEDKAQTWFTRNAWNDTNIEIQKRYYEGRKITGICYSPGLRQYLVVMTEMPEGQCYLRFDSTKEGYAAKTNWMGEKYGEGFHPTIIFKAPTGNKIVIVMTKDENRSDYELRLNYPLK